MAVLIPCLNEEKTIGQVVKDFSAELPEAQIYVFDNGSQDSSAKLAAESGAVVFQVPVRGKGNVVRSMFRRVHAEIYILVDGDNTYFANDVHKLIKPVVDSQRDMVVGDRLSNKAYDTQNRRHLHGFGNRLICWLVSKLFRTDCKDILSGYRVFSCRFVDNFATISEGFEIETELTLHALDRKYQITEVPIQYRNRPAGSESKLSTFKDGFRILKAIALIFKNYKPLIFFGSIAAILSFIGFVLGMFPIMEYIREQYVHRVPLAILAASLQLLAMLSLVCGLILDTTVRQHKELLELRMMDYIRRREKGGD